MNNYLRALCFIGFLVAFVPSTFAATTTMSGMISDSMCGASHAQMMAQHPGLKTDRACTQACVKGGAKYVFVSNEVVYQIANQDLAALPKEAGESVSMTGDVNRDTITVAKLVPAKK
jgi:hypothetical protein